MSKVLKKIVRGVKKVFKKVVKVVKKIVKSDIFKVVAGAAAVYFTLGAAAGMLSGGAATGAGSGAVTAGATKTAAANVSALGKIGAAGAKSAGITKSAGVLQTVSSAGKALGSAVSGMTPGQGAFAAAALQTGGAVLSGYGRAKAEEAERERIERNMETDIDVYGNYQGSAMQYATENRPTYATDRPPVRNVDRRPPVSYDASKDAWTPVSKAARSAA